eukprot:gene3368-13401_t
MYWAGARADSLAFLSGMAAAGPSTAAHGVQEASGASGVTFELIIPEELFSRVYFGFMFRGIGPGGGQGGPRTNVCDTWADEDSNPSRVRAVGVFICTLDKLGISLDPLVDPARSAAPAGVRGVRRQNVLSVMELQEAARSKGWTALGLVKGSSPSAEGGQLLVAPSFGQLLIINAGDKVAVLAHGEP